MARKTTRRTAPTKSTRGGKSAKNARAPARRSAKPARPSKATKAGKVTNAGKPAVRATRVRKAPAKAATTGPSQPAITPVLTVPDVQAAVDLLGKLGFEPTMTMPHPEEGLMYAILSYKNANLHVSAMEVPGVPDTPRMRAIRDGPVGLGVNLYVMVDDIARVHNILRGTDVDILQQPKDEFWGDRTLVCVDPFGFEWSFAQHVKDVSPEDMARAAEEASRRTETATAFA